MGSPEDLNEPEYLLGCDGRKCGASKAFAWLLEYSWLYALRY